MFGLAVPFSYLGFLLGGNVLTDDFKDPIVAKVTKILIVGRGLISRWGTGHLDSILPVSYPD